MATRASGAYRWASSLQTEESGSQSISRVEERSPHRLLQTQRATPAAAHAAAHHAEQAGRIHWFPTCPQQAQHSTAGAAGAPQRAQRIHQVDLLRVRPAAAAARGGGGARGQEGSLLHRLRSSSRGRSGGCGPNETRGALDHTAACCCQPCLTPRNCQPSDARLLEHAQAAPGGRRLLASQGVCRAAGAARSTAAERTGCDTQRVRHAAKGTRLQRVPRLSATPCSWY